MFEYDAQLCCGSEIISVTSHCLDKIQKIPYFSLDFQREHRCQHPWSAWPFSESSLLHTGQHPQSLSWLLVMSLFWLQWDSETCLFYHILRHTDLTSLCQLERTEEPHVEWRRTRDADLLSSAASFWPWCWNSFWSVDKKQHLKFIKQHEEKCGKEMNTYDDLIFPHRPEIICPQLPLRDTQISLRQEYVHLSKGKIQDESFPHHWSRQRVVWRCDTAPDSVSQLAHGGHFPPIDPPDVSSAIISGSVW